MKAFLVVVAGAGLFGGARYTVEAQTDRSVARIEAITGAAVVVSGPDGQGFDPRIGGDSPNSWQAVFALRALERALEAYPPEFLEQRGPRVLIAGELYLLDFQIGGTVQPPDWVLLASNYLFAEAGSGHLRRSFHHEYSSVLMADVPFPEEAWRGLLPDGFAFPDNDAERLAATQVYADDLTAFHEQGFVSDYGASSLENDINTYAELLMDDPDGLAELALAHVRVREKVALIRGYYEALHPDFAQRFDATALGDL